MHRYTHTHTYFRTFIKPNRECSNRLCFVIRYGVFSVLAVAAAAVEEVGGSVVPPKTIIYVLD